MNFRRGKMTGETLRAIVGRQMNRPAPPDHLMSKRLGREKMSAGSACREKNGPLGHRNVYPIGSTPCGMRSNGSALRFSGLRRVNARTMPIEMAIAISDEPP